MVSESLIWWLDAKALSFMHNKSNLLDKEKYMGDLVDAKTLL